MTKNTRNIKDIFLGLQDQMQSKLSLNRRILTHPVAKGDASELEWVEMLSSYLPKRYQAEKAFVIDHEGVVSEQIDIVIFDRHYSPFLLRQNGATYVPAESVYAVIEVKPDLNPKTIKYTAKKAYSVRNLKRTSAAIVHAGGRIEKTKKPFEIFAGILSINGSLTKAAEDEIRKLSTKKRVHFGCSLDSGAFNVEYGDPVAIEKSSKESGLIVFFLKLLSTLQSVGTAPAMEIDKYIANIK